MREIREESIKSEERRKERGEVHNYEEITHNH